MKPQNTYELERVHDLLNYLTAAYLTVNSLEVITQGKAEVLKAKESMEECIAVAKSCFTSVKGGLFSIHDEMTKVLSIFEPVYKRQGVMIDYINASPYAIAQGDRVQFRRALSNITKNATEAATHSLEKTVRIRIRKRKNRIVICITDTGMGIPQHVLQKVGTERISTKKSDRGYGMLSTKRIIEESYGGTMHLRNSAKKNGATCTISLSPMCTKRSLTLP